MAGSSGRRGPTGLPRRSASKAELLGLLPDYFAGKTASVKIHKADGSIEEERTYPRAADPRRTKG